MKAGKKYSFTNLVVKVNRFRHQNVQLFQKSIVDTGLQDRQSEKRQRPHVDD